MLGLRGSNPLDSGPVSLLIRGRPKITVCLLRHWPNNQLRTLRAHVIVRLLGGCTADRIDITGRWGKCGREKVFFAEAVRLTLY
jgi:hypothetical protein